MIPVVRNAIRYPVRHPVVSAPLALSDFSVTGGPGPFMGNVPFSITTQADPQLACVALYRVPYGGTLDKTSHIFKRVTVPADATTAVTIGDATRTNLVTNGTFAADSDWTKGTGWTISSGTASKASGAYGVLSQAIAAIGSASVGTVFRWSVTQSASSGGGIIPRLITGTLVNASTQTGDGFKTGTLTKVSGNDTFGFQVSAVGYVGSIDDACLYERSSTVTTAGDWDWYAIPENALGWEGTATTAQRAKVV